MRKIILLSLSIVLLVVIGCSTGAPKAIKSDSDKETTMIDSPQELVRHADSYDLLYKLEFPITDNDVRLRSIQAIPIIQLKSPLIYYWRAEGQFPESMKEWVNSGYPLVWPRNLSDGTPIKVSNAENLEPDETLLGTILYRRIDDQKVEINRVGYDAEGSEAAGEQKWKIRTSIFPEDYPEGLSGIYTNGGKISIDSFEDYNKRRLYALCAEFGFFLQCHTSKYFVTFNDLPDSFDDLIFSREFIIKENFDAFADLLKNSNADFRYGFDYDNRTNYIYLAIDGEVLFSACNTYGSSQTAQYSYFCEEIEGLDMSNPILTSANISQFEIPDGYLISVKDIPVGD